MNSFWLESPRPFKPHLVERAARELLEEELGPQGAAAQHGGGAHVPASGPLALKIAAQLRERIVELDFLRYKFMVVAQVTEKKSQGLHTCSRFVWDSDRDTYATCRHETEALIALVTVYAVYYD